jgi:putative transposase
MKTGQQLDIILSYSSLYKLDPQTARSALLEVFRQTNNIAQTARMFTTTRRVVQLAIRKDAEGDLADKSHVAKTVHNRTDTKVEEKAIAIKNSTHFGYRRVAKELRDKQGILVKDEAVRNILKRARVKGLLKGEKVRSSNGKEVRFYDWYTAEPFEIIQTDLKDILDKKALPQQVYHHLQRHNLPPYQWTAECVNTRVRFLCYSYEKSFTNGLTFYLMVIAWLRAHNIRAELVFTVDWGEEFGGKSRQKITDLRKLLKPLGATIHQNHKGQSEENGFVERSHRTDDEEFYIPRLQTIKNQNQFFLEALNWTWYYNTKRGHTGNGMADGTPYQKLQQQYYWIPKDICAFPPLLLDNISTNIGPWGGYNLLAHYQTKFAPYGHR